MEIIQKILSSEYFKDKPPVLADVGASGEINSKWKRVAPYSVCICFDADDREFKIDDVENSGYKKLLKINRAVIDKPIAKTNFYFTRSPYCSSTLEPLTNELNPWLFKSYFDVVKKTEIAGTTIENSLSVSGINYIDWLKLDSQGTDLRLYKSLPGIIKQSILAAEFEPGIIDAYRGEDKLHEVMKYLHDDGYWLCSMKVKGTKRIEEKYLNVFGEGNIGRAIPESPGWAELTYLKKSRDQDLRSLFLLYVFAIIQQQYGFALEVCSALINNTNDPLVEEARLFVVNYIKAQDLKNTNFKSRVKNYLLRKLQD